MSPHEKQFPISFMITQKNKLDSIDLIIGHIDGHVSYKSGPTSESTTTFRSFPHTLTDSRLLREPAFGDEDILCPFCNLKIKLRFFSLVYYELTANETNRDILQNINLRHNVFFTGVFTSLFAVCAAGIIGLSTGSLLLSAVAFISPVSLGCIIALLVGKARIAKGVRLNKRFLVSSKYGNEFKERMDAGPKNYIHSVEVDSQHGIVVAGKSGTGVGAGGNIIQYQASDEVLTGSYDADRKSCKEYNACDDYFAGY